MILVPLLSVALPGRVALLSEEAIATVSDTVLIIFQ